MPVEWWSEDIVDTGCRLRPASCGDSHAGPHERINTDSSGHCNICWTGGGIREAFQSNGDSAKIIAPRPLVCIRAITSPAVKHPQIALHSFQEPQDLFSLSTTISPNPSTPATFPNTTFSGRLTPATFCS